MKKHGIVKTLFCAALSLSFLAPSEFSVMSLRASEPDSSLTLSQSNQSFRVIKDSHIFNGSQTDDPKVQGFSGSASFDWESRNADGTYSPLSEAPVHAGSYRVRARTDQALDAADSENSKEGFSIPESVTLVINGTAEQQSASAAPTFTPADMKAEVSYAVITTRFNDDTAGFATVEKNLVADTSSPRQSKSLNDKIVAQIESKEINFFATDLFELNTKTGLITLSSKAVPQMRGTYYLAVSVKRNDQEITRLIPVHITTNEATGIELLIRRSGVEESATSPFTYTIDSTGKALYLPAGVSLDSINYTFFEFFVASIPLNAPLPSSVTYDWRIFKDGLELTDTFTNTSGSTAAATQSILFVSSEEYADAHESLASMFTVLPALEAGKSYTIEVSASQYFATQSCRVIFTADGRPPATLGSLAAMKPGFVFVPLDNQENLAETLDQPVNDASGFTTEWVEFQIYPFEVWGEDYQAAPEPISQMLFENAKVSVQGHEPLREGIDFTKSEGKTVSSLHGSFKPGEVRFASNYAGKTYNPYLLSDYTTYTDIGGNWWWNNPDQNWAQLATISGLMYGYTPSGGTGEFGPNDYINRAMAARIIWNMEGNPAPRSTASFEDIPEDQYYTEAVAWCSEKGIIVGVGNNRYNPSAPVERQHFMKMLYKYAQYANGDGAEVPDEVIERYTDASSVSGGNSFDDVYKAVNWALGNRIITGSGTSVKRIAPSAFATRMQAAKILTMAHLVISGNKN